MWIEKVGLPPRAYHLYPYELSGGMKKRVGIARAMATNPEILFLDEPTSGLDPYSAGKFDELIMTLKESLQLTVVMITHDLDSVHDCVDRFIMLKDGLLEFNGDLKDFIKKAQTQGLDEAQFIQFNTRREILERHVNYTLIGGLFFFLCLVCMVGFILWLGHLGLDDGKYYEYVVYTDKDLGGIATNSPINYKGIQVGNVIKVGFAKDKVGVVRLDLMIKSSVKIRKDSKVAVSSRGFMGLKFLALEQSHNEEFYGSGDKGERILIFKEAAYGSLER